MAPPHILPLPPDLLLVGDYVIRVTALDPTTGNTMTGVDVSNVTLQVEDLAGSSGASLASGPFMLVPGPGA